MNLNISSLDWQVVFLHSWPLKQFKCFLQLNPQITSSLLDVMADWSDKQSVQQLWGKTELKYNISSKKDTEVMWSWSPEIALKQSAERIQLCKCFEDRNVFSLDCEVTAKCWDWTLNWNKNKASLKHKFTLKSRFLLLNTDGKHLYCQQVWVHCSCCHLSTHHHVATLFDIKFRTFSKFLFEILYQIWTRNLKSKNIFAKIHKGGT